MKCARCPIDMNADPSSSSSTTTSFICSSNPADRFFRKINVKIATTFFTLIEIKYIFSLLTVCVCVWVSANSMQNEKMKNVNRQLFLSLQKKHIRFFIKPIFVFFKHRFSFSSCFSIKILVVFLFFLCENSCSFLWLRIEDFWASNRDKFASVFLEFLGKWSVYS